MSRTFNRDPKYMTGAYAKMFEIEPIASNAQFVQNPYKPNTCRCGDTVSFSLTEGARKCQRDQTKMAIFNTEGQLVTVPVSHDGPASSKNINSVKEA